MVMQRLCIPRDSNPEPADSVSVGRDLVRPPALSRTTLLVLRAQMLSDPWEMTRLVHLQPWAGDQVVVCKLLTGTGRDGICLSVPLGHRPTLPMGLPAVGLHQLP